MQGPASGSDNSFTWYLISWDGKTPNGYTASQFYSSVVPDKPATSAPGSGTSPGTTVNTTSPNFQWGTVKGGSHINIYIRDTGTSVLQNFIDVASVGGTWTPPAGTLLAGHNYKWNMQASDSVGDSPVSNDLYFQVASSPGSINAQLRNVNGNLATASNVRFRLYTSPTQDISGSNPATFSSIPAGSYLLEGYQTGTFLGEEFWNSEPSVAVANGATTPVVVTRKYPYASTVVIKNNSTNAVISPGQSVSTGIAMRAEVTVQNDVGSSLNAKVRFLLDMDRSSTGFDYDSGFTSMLSVGANGGTRTYSFVFTPPSTGQFYYALEVFTDVNSSPIRTDSYTWTQTCLVSPPPSVTKLVPTIPNPIDDVVPAIDGKQTIDVYGTGFSYGGSFNVRMIWKTGFADLLPNEITQISATHFKVFVNLSSSPDTWLVIVTNSDGQVSATHSFTALPNPSILTLQTPAYSEPSGVPTVQLTWGASTNAESYDVLRDGVVIAANLPSTTLSYTDNANFVRLQTYAYTIRAKNRVGSVLSNATNATIQAANSPIITITSPTGGSYQVGAPVNIAWTLSGVTAQVNYFKVAILDNGDEDPNRIFVVGLSGRSLTWTPPSTFIRSNVTIRVQTLSSSNNVLSFGVSPAFSTVASGSAIAVIAQLSGPVYLTTPFTFSAAGSSPTPGRTITSYEWVFSDGGQSNGLQATHTFASGTLGYAILTISDGLNSSSASVIFPLRGIGPPSQNQSGASRDPVNSATGNFIMNPTLLSVPGRGVPFVFQAFYNSKAFDPMEANPIPGPLGFGWTHNFEINAKTQGIEDGIQFVIITFGDGHKEKFRLINSAWTTDPGIYNTLAEAADGSFALTSRNQITSRFNTSGDLISISDRNGNTLSVVWEPLPGDATKFRIARVELPGGSDPGNPRKVLFAYDETSGHLKTLTDPITRTVQFTVDASHDLRAIKNPRGNSTNYTYDPLHQLLTGIDARGHKFVENFYDSSTPPQRVVVRQIDADNNETLFDYHFDALPNAYTKITRTALPASEVTEDHHNAKLQLEERKVYLADGASLSDKFGYDPVTGDRTTVIDRNGNTCAYEYTNGNVTKITNPDGGITQIEYDGFNNPILKTILRPNASSIVAKWDYNATGNLLAYTFPFDQNNPTQYKHAYTPDAYGQTTSVTDANNHTTHTYFNDFGDTWKVEDAETPPNSKTFDLDGIGRRKGVTDERGNHTTFDLNNNGGVETTTLPDPNGPTTIKQVFDENDNSIKIEDQLHRFSYFDFDNQDRPYKVRNHLLQETDTQFDVLGRAVSVQDPKHHFAYRAYDLAARVTEITDQMGRKHTYTRDGNGNVRTDIDSDGVKVEYFYDSINRCTKVRRYTSATEFDETTTNYNTLGQIASVVDANQNSTFYFYNDAGQLIRIVDSKNQEFIWAYDFEGNLTSATHPSASGPKTRYQTFTARNQIATRTDENGKLEQFFYDAAGNLDHTINADGQTISFAYDSLNRLTTVGYPTGPPVQFTYDAAGQRRFMDDALGRTEWTYTLLGQIETVTDPFGKQLGFHYDDNGNRDTINYPGNKQASYAYDDANLLKSVTDWQGRTINRSFTPGGRISTIAFPNGVTTQVGHDFAGRENDIQHQKAPAVPFIHFGYTFDSLGGIKEITPQAHPLPKQFAAGSNNYTYDAANQLATIDGTAVTHDNRGNIVQGKLTSTSTGNDTLTWDAAGRLTAFNIGGVSGSNSYNALGHRLQTTRGAETKRFVVDGAGSLAQVMAETDSSGTIAAYYLYAGGLAARILPDGSVSYYHSDRQGNTLALTDGGGSTTDLYQYDEFGVPAGSSGSTANPFRYLGGFGVYDNGDGTLFARARTYHPDLGRFLSRDALFGNQKSGQSLNRYVYALNDALRFVDVNGFAHQEGILRDFYLTDYRTANSTPAYVQGGRGFDWSGITPVYGSLRDAMTAGREGHYWTAAGDTALAISDVFLVKAIATAGIKIIVTEGAEILAKKSADETVIVYRGVHAEHPQLTNALEGRAEPIGGHSAPALHNEGDNRSIFTSWTTDHNTAAWWAQRYGPGGVILEQTVNRSTLIESPDIYSEFEVLRVGTVEGATPTILGK